MKRPIKFRGKTFDDKVVFGYYVPQCPMSSFPGIVDDYDYIHEVKPDSVAQLVGYDKHGLEVYEGDILERAESLTNAQRLSIQLVIHDLECEADLLREQAVLLSNAINELWHQEAERD